MPKKQTASDIKPGTATSTRPERPIPPFPEFRAAVKYIMIHEHGMPELLAEEILADNEEFLERKRQCLHQLGEGAIAQVADGLIYTPPKGVKWVALDKGERVAEECQVVLDANGALGRYLDSLVKLGLHGDNRDEVARAMMAKGIETVFPLIAGVRSPAKAG